jgi:hypothetical protein
MKKEMKNDLACVIGMKYMDSAQMKTWLSLKHDLIADSIHWQTQKMMIDSWDKIFIGIKMPHQH